MLMIKQNLFPSMCLKCFEYMSSHLKVNNLVTIEQGVRTIQS